MTLEDVVIYAGTMLCLWLLGVLTSLVMWRRHRIVLDLSARHDATIGEVTPAATAPAPPARPHRWRHALAHR